MEASPHLHLVDTATGQVEEQCPDCLNAERALRAERAKVTKLKNEMAKLLGVEDDAEYIIDVLKFWRPLCMPGAQIVAGSPRWLKTRDRLRDRSVETKKLIFTPLHLKAAVVGAKLSDWHVEHKMLDAESIFMDADRVQKHIARATNFKRQTAVSALSIVEELSAERFAWLAERCSCGHTWLSHLRHTSLQPDGSQPCAECGCPTYDFFTARVDRFMREQEAS